jgi:hypothetical protein
MFIESGLLADHLEKLECASVPGSFGAGVVVVA